EVLHSLFNKLFPVLKDFLVEIPDDVDKFCFFDISVESEQMVKTFPFLCRFRCLLRWEHFSYIHSNFRRVNKFSFCCSWMDAIAVDSDFCRRSVEAFILQFTKRAAVDCIS